jgi:general secretion pathway protein G
MDIRQRISRLSSLLPAARVARGRRGMTLMEVMIVIAIILLLMGVLTFGLGGMFNQAQGDAAMLQINRINEQVRIYQIKKKKVPGDLKDLFDGETVPLDPWGNEYLLKQGGKNGYDIVSLGADGKEGGTGSDADIKLSDSQGGGK